MVVRLKKLAKGLFILLLLLCGLGIIYQSVGAGQDMHTYPPPGQLVDVGGYKLHLNCVGEGSPTVVLEALAGGSSSYWGWVQPEIAQNYRVCTYDRAGRGWSDPNIPAQDLWQTAVNLHTLLQNADIEGPYILVGHSIGGLYVRAFTDLYPDEVVGLVLLDAAHPEQLDRYPALAGESESYLRVASFFPALARIGLFRLYFHTGGEIDFQDMPTKAHDEIATMWSSPAYFHSQRSEIALAPTIYEQAQDLPSSLGNLPLTVISAGHGVDGWSTLQAELAAISSNSRHITMDDATHTSLIFNADYAHQTSEAILQLANLAQK